MSSYGTTVNIKINKYLKICYNWEKLFTDRQ